MPECFGLTMRDVFGQMTTAGITPKLFGTGVAIYQSPSPGTDMIEGEKAVVIFAKPSQLMSELGDSPEAALKFVRGAMGPMEP